MKLLPFRLKIPVVARITFGLIGLMTSVLMLVSMLGLFPDSRKTTIRNRKSFCESTAISFTLMADRADAETMQVYLESLAQRNAEVQSLGVRRMDGELLVAAGDHQAHWDRSAARSNDGSHISVQFNSDGEPWGSIEAAFTPLDSSGYLAALASPELLHGIVAAAICLGAFYLYLRMVLRHLDPSQAIPKRVREALNTLAEGLLILDRQERIVLANEAFEKLTGTKQQQLLGSSINKIPFVCREEETSTVAPWTEASQNGQSVTGRLLGVDFDDNHGVTFSVSAAPILDDSGTPRGILVSFEDVTPLEQKKRELNDMLQCLRSSSDAIKQQNRELERLASSDPLTGCLNRRSFFERFEKSWKVSESTGSPLSVLMVDVDFFKSINDTYGHAMGDDVLRKVGATLLGIARETDSACRYGGEEFAFLMPATDLDEANGVGERIRTTLESIQFPEFTITASIGVSTRTAQSENPEQLLDQADKCLYVAKRGGRNQVVRWDAVPEDLEVDESKISRTKEDETTDVVSIPYQAVTALMLTLAYRDQAIASHSRRVADLCVATGEKILTLSECYTLEIAALLHDIGKIGLPDSILLKPGPPTDDEWRIMRQHNRLGIEIVRAAFGSPKLTEIVEHARAHYNNAEQPDHARSGEAIPVASRILAIADAFDSMTTDQVFRKGRSVNEAFAELRRCAGTQFDPELVERFIEVTGNLPHAKPRAAEGISKETALVIGLQIERLSQVLDQQDFDALDAMSRRLQSTAHKYGAEHISDKASELGSVIEQDTDHHSVIRVANELLDLCRSTQQSFLESDFADDPDAPVCA